MVKIWKFLKAYRLHLGVTLLLLAVAALVPFQPYYERAFMASELEIPDGARQAAALTEETEENPSVLLVSAESGYAGAAAEIEDVTLQEGTYRIQVVALAEESGSRREVYDTGRLNRDNTQG